MHCNACFKASLPKSHQFKTFTQLLHYLTSQKVKQKTGNIFIMKQNLIYKHIQGL